MEAYKRPEGGLFAPVMGYVQRRQAGVSIACMMNRGGYDEGLAVEASGGGGGGGVGVCEVAMVRTDSHEKFDEEIYVWSSEKTRGLLTDAND